MSCNSTSANGIPTEDRCAICHYTPILAVNLNPCQNLFCFFCVARCLKVDKECPICQSRCLAVFSGQLNITWWITLWIGGTPVRGIVNNGRTLMHELAFIDYVWFVLRAKHQLQYSARSATMASTSNSSATATRLPWSRILERHDYLMRRQPSTTMAATDFANNRPPCSRILEAHHSNKRRRIN